MAFSLAIHAPLNFVFTQCGSILDDHVLRIHLLNLQAHINGMETVRELIDARTIRKADRATIKGMVELAGLDRAVTAGSDQTIAIITDDPLGRKIADLYANALADNKKAIGFFTDVLPALYWLGYGKPEVARLQGFMRRHRA
jgi:hypothetical protein